MSMYKTLEKSKGSLTGNAVVVTITSTEEQLHAKIQQGYESYKAGRTQNAAAAFQKFQESHG